MRAPSLGYMTRARHTLATLALLLMVPAAAHAAPNTVAAEALSPATTTGAVAMSDVDMAPDGDALAVWMGAGTDAGKVLAATRPAGGDWTTGSVITSAVANIAWVETEVGPDGSAVAVVTTR